MSISPRGVIALAILSLIVPQLQKVGLGRRSSTRVTHFAAPAHGRGAFTAHARGWGQLLFHGKLRKYNAPGRATRCYQMKVCLYWVWETGTFIVTIC